MSGYLIETFCPEIFFGTRTAEYLVIKVLRTKRFYWLFFSSGKVLLPCERICFSFLYSSACFIQNSFITFVLYCIRSLCLTTLRPGCQHTSPSQGLLCKDACTLIKDDICQVEWKEAMSKQKQLPNCTDLPYQNLTLGNGQCIFPQLFKGTFAFLCMKPDMFILQTVPKCTK